MRCLNSSLTRDSRCGRGVCLTFRWSLRRAGSVAFVERQWGRATTRAGYTFVIVTSAGLPVGQVGLWLRDLEQGRASLGYWAGLSGRPVPGRMRKRAAPPPPS
ncbi:GNAT family N-acetyltransferase [Streptomyces sp. NPDC051452]|uniref:GNAT family N-acetyltransferase n=1 Tax=Streptomyces sp. NPDC051452 TaxID=3365654 RepID=UPI0037B4DDE1